MSRLYDALQKSQGENATASPLVPPPVEEVPSESSAAAAAAAASSQPPLRAPSAVPVDLPPAPPRIPAAYSSGIPAVEPAFLASDTTDGTWLRVPADRILHPRPTPEQRLVSIADPDSAGAEMFRVLSTRLAHMQRKRRLQKLLITSSESDEGKSVVAVNLAFSIARRPNERTLLIEADLRRPSASRFFTNAPLPGIAEWSEGNLAIEDSLYQVNDLPLWFLSAGHGVEEPMPLLESERFAKMLETVSSSFDWVLIDSSPMLPMADSTSLSRLCDGVLVVVREGYTRRRVLTKALASIEQHKLIGMVLNQASMLKIGYDRYYGSKNGKSKSEPKEEGSKVDAASA
jgi:capsular exopolysaccharide synthesis family protein